MTHPSKKSSVLRLLAIIALVIAIGHVLFFCYIIFSDSFDFGDEAELMKK